MKPWCVWIVAAAFFGGGSGLLRADLVLVQKVEESGSQRPPAEIRLKVKGTQIRADLSPEITLLMDTATGDTTTLCHPKKTALLLPGDTARRLQEEIRKFPETGAGTASQEAPPKLVATGRHETVGGRETEIFTAGSGAVKITWWVARKGNDWEKYLPQLAPLQQAPMVQLAASLGFLPPGLELPGLAVKTELCAPDGRRIVTTLLAIKEEPLENIDFTIPPGYRSLAEPLFRSPLLP